MAADDLWTQGGRASTAKVLTYIALDIPHLSLDLDRWNISISKSIFVKTIEFLHLTIVLWGLSDGNSALAEIVSQVTKPLSEPIMNEIPTTCEDLSQAGISNYIPQ